MTAAVVVLAPATVVPAGAIAAVRHANVVYAGEGVDPRPLDAKPAPGPAELLTEAATRAVVLFATSAADPAAVALLGAGAQLVEAEPSPLQRAVAVMDRLRSSGGCPWDAEQTHDSLRQYLVEECYELLDAIETGDRAALLEELGDVLLQVLFHARVAAEHDVEPFDIDDVAAELADKLVGRHPHVVFASHAGEASSSARCPITTARRQSLGFADAEVVHTAERQQHRWEELKQVEKRRESVVDGVALGQPSVALVAKLAQRTGRAGLPAELFPQDDGAAAELFRIAAAAKRAGAEPEGELRAVAKRFAAAVRATETAARADGIDPAKLDAAGWRRYWTSA
ncbi:MAG: nucleoside triphosphate pyrophosphohydrolase [Actinophytocola sp.]|nr:nucleoside triphosphate pyrophosphohydrolase [Actinophytocola sp.]